MADVTKAWDDGSKEVVLINGRQVSLFVDQYCIMCPICTEIAPKHFRLSPSKDHYQCFQQPRTVRELERCLEAAAHCPTDSIGDRRASSGKSG